VFVLVAIVATGSATAGARQRERRAGKWPPRILELVRFVERDRGLRFKHPVRVSFLSDREFKRRLFGGASPNDIPREVRQAVREQAAYLHAVGLLDAGVDLLTASRRQIANGVAGFYSYRTREVMIREGRISDPIGRVNVVHELTHALQDQRFDLDGRNKRPAAAFAITTLAEGDARTVERNYFDALSPEDQEHVRAARDPAGAEVSEAPAYIVASFGAPYIIGPGFVKFLTARGERDDAFRRPPSTDEQVTDPIAFIERQDPVTVKAPKLRSGEHREGKPGFVGPLVLYLALAARLDTRTALAASTGWRGDRLVKFSVGHRDCVRDAMSFDRLSDGEELSAALKDWSAGMAEGSVRIRTAGSRVTFSICNDDSVPSPTRDRLVDALRALSGRWSVFAEIGDVDAPLADVRCVADRVVTDPAVVDEATKSERIKVAEVECGADFLP
jgi:hypothetical protein